RSGRWETAARSVAHPVRAAGPNGATSTRPACHQRHAPQHLVLEAAGGWGGELPLGPADEGVEFPPVVEAVVADDAPGGDAVVVVGGGHRQLGDDLQDHEGAVGGFEDDVDVAVEFAVDVGDLAVDAGPGGAPAAGGQGVDAGRGGEAGGGGGGGAARGAR